MNTEPILLVAANQALADAVKNEMKRQKKMVLHEWTNLAATHRATIPTNTQWGILCFASCEEALQLTEELLHLQPDLQLIGVCKELTNDCRLALLQKGMQHFVLEPKIGTIPRYIDIQPELENLSIKENLDLLHQPQLMMKEEEKTLLLSDLILKLKSKKLSKIIIVLWNERSFTVRNIATYLDCKMKTVHNQLGIIYKRLQVKNKEALVALLSRCICFNDCMQCKYRAVCTKGILEMKK